MKTRLITFIPLLLLCRFCMAQTPALKQAPAGAVIDGHDTEWPKDLFALNSKAKLSYVISYDKDNIFLIIRTNDAQRQSSILGAGVTFSMDTHGKKKSEYVITFPAAEKNDNPEDYINLFPEQITAKANATRNRRIKVAGFKDITDEFITPLNPFGVKVSISYDETGYLIYEAAIPQMLFKESIAGKELAFNIKVNGLEKTSKATAIIISRNANAANNIPGQPASAGFGGSSVEQLTPAIDFWTKFKME